MAEIVWEINLVNPLCTWHEAEHCQLGVTKAFHALSWCLNLQTLLSVTLLSTIQRPYGERTFPVREQDQKALLKALPPSQYPGTVSVLHRPLFSAGKQSSPPKCASSRVTKQADGFLSNLRVAYSLTKVFLSLIKQFNCAN